MGNTNILIIGMPKMGKTHFGGQLYGRLKNMENDYKLHATPEDLSIFESIWKSLNNGIEGDRTSTQQHKTVLLTIVDNNAQAIDLVYPDYGGEQIKNMVEEREINSLWQNQIEHSNSWLLFIRLDLMEKIGDATTKFYKLAEGEDKEEIQEREKEKVELLEKLPEISSVFYIELLQMFLHAKKIRSGQLTKFPKLTVVLSCWDRLNCPENTLPEQELKEYMPMLYSFITNVWEKDNMDIIGLSSLGMDLNKNAPNSGYQIQGPEYFGYWINTSGKEIPDITQILNITA